MTDASRISTGIPELDDMLGGGLLPGRMAVVLGATGIGKTQLGLQFAAAGRKQEGEAGVIFDMTCRGDSQNHSEYAERMCDWRLRTVSPETHFPAERVWDREATRADYIHLFSRSGRRVTMGDLNTDDWREWKIELTRKLDLAIAFLYGNFVHGVRRLVIDGIEPTDRASDSFQFHLFDYIYHQILHKEADWVARDLFRAKFREHQERVMAHLYDSNQLGAMLLYTSHEVMLEELLSRKIESGDVLSNANTIILMGKVRDGLKMGRALYVAKHRGSAHSEEIVPFEVATDGLKFRRA